MSAIPEKASPQSPSGGGAEWPPSWRTMPHGISTGRYIDPDFLKLEYQRLWSRVWQVAARVDEIPEVNDYTTYEIGDQSVILVRVRFLDHQGLLQCLSAPRHSAGGRLWNV